jgi:hypothetical protein
VAPAAREPVQEHTSSSRPAAPTQPQPRAVAPSHNAPAKEPAAPSPKASTKGNASGGIVRDVPF